MRGFEHRSQVTQLPAPARRFLRHRDQRIDVLAERALTQFHPATLLDVGVNLGQTLLAVKAIEPSRPYIGVEPNPLCVACTEKLIAINELSECRVVPVGLANNSGILKLQLYHGITIDSSASLIDDFRPNNAITHVKLVPVFPFSEIERALEVVELGVVKVDVEGGEADVLTSMRKALVEFRPWLIVEILPCYDKSNVERVRRQISIEELMRDVEYNLFRIIKTDSNDWHGVKAIDKIGIHASIEMCDYVFCPYEDAERFSAAVSIVDMY